VNNIYTFKQFLERHSFLTYGGLRWRIFHAEENGLDSFGAIIRDGRKILIDETKYFEWLNAQNT